MTDSTWGGIMRKWSLSDAMKKHRYRKWIRSTLSRKNGRAHLNRLEDDIGVERGYFEKESQGCFSKNTFASETAGNREESDGQDCITNLP
jgi:hypothetical protein